MGRSGLSWCARSRLDQGPNPLAPFAVGATLLTIDAALKIRRAEGRKTVEILPAVTTFAVVAVEWGVILALSMAFGPTRERSPLVAFLDRIDLPAIPILIALFIFLSWRLSIDWRKAAALKAEQSGRPTH